MSKTKATHQDDTEFDGPVDKGSAKRPLDKDQGDKNPDTSAAKPVTVFPSGKVAEEEILALFAGVEGLSEDFAPRATTLFEGAVSARVATIREQLDAEYTEKLDEAYAIVESDLADKIDTYMNYVAEQYMTENQVAIDSGIKVEFAESIVRSAVAIVEQAGIALPDEKVDVAEALQTELATAEASLNEALAKVATLNEEIRQAGVEKALATVSEGLTEAGRERLRKLTESITDLDVAEFTTRANVLKETVAESGAKVLNESVQEVTEAVPEKPVSKNPAMERYLSVARSGY